MVTLLLLILAAAATTGIRRVDWSFAGEECQYASSPTGVVEERALPGGFAVRIVAGGQGVDEERRCLAEVTGPDGTVVWQGFGFGARLDPWTGDLDGDGHHDVVIAIEEGGGNRGSWRSAVIGLRWPGPVVVELGFWPDLIPLPGAGVVLIETVAFYGLGPSMAETPVAVRVHRVGAGRITDATRAFCPRLVGQRADSAFARHAAPVLDSAALTRARQAGASFDAARIRVDAMSRILQLRVCGDDEAARAVARAAWPAAEWAERYSLLVGALGRLPGDSLKPRR